MVGGGKGQERLLQISQVDREPVRLSRESFDLQARDDGTDDFRFKNKTIGEMVREKNEKLRRAKGSTSLSPERKQLNEIIESTKGLMHKPSPIISPRR